MRRGLWVTEEETRHAGFRRTARRRIRATGPGNTLRILLIVSIVGAALLAWFLLRGYRENGGDDNHND
ncbi:hypothetical protein HRW07_02255 [Streptomyces lunaelactis]|uniref:hypothetical protein n=1 Tax=Streptomyces lunaelactis TaxID=1535768 RepID=UPI001585642A|nr:hypothetical protein [Streptomyces lunaelactis]NUL02087.1 hypothetical protein [Streptomyces lunaelactis]